MRPTPAFVLLLAACNPSWEEAAPVVQDHCVSCHSEEGGAPHVFRDAESLMALAPVARSHVLGRTMPPWPPSSDAEPLLGDRTLPQEDLHVLAAWLADPVPGHAVLDEPVRDELRVDATLDVPAFSTPEGEGRRCFVVDLPDAQLSAYAVTRSGPVHHVLVGRFDDRDALDALDALDPNPGWDCPDAFMPGAEPRPEQVPVLWFPGSNPTRSASGTGQVLRGAGVVQVHSSGSGTAGVRIDLELGTGLVQERTLSLGAGGIDPEAQPMVVRTAYIRDWMRAADLAETQGRIWVTGARGHGHDRLTRLTLRSEDHMLLDLVRWEVDWQMRYLFAEPVELDPDAPLTLECQYGDSDGGYPSDREMCGGWLFFTTAAP